MHSAASISTTWPASSSPCPAAARQTTKAEARAIIRAASSLTLVVRLPGTLVCTSVTYRLCLGYCRSGREALMKHKPLHLVVLAAGEGKRMNSSLPKVLQPIAGRPMLAHLLSAALALDPARVHVVIGHGAGQVSAMLGSFDDARLASVAQQERLGTGHAVQQAMRDIPESARVIVLPGDMPLVRSAALAASSATRKAASSAFASSAMPAMPRPALPR